MNVEEALESLGTWGRWHITNFLILAVFLAFIPTFSMLSIVWISHTPEHHCRLPEGASINDSIPRDSDGRLSQCFKYLNHSLSNQTVACDDGWLYDPNDSYTIVNKWDLVCDKEFYSQLPQTSLVLGVMIGSLVTSFLSDKFGRKKVFLFGQLSWVVVAVVCTLVTNFYIFLVIRFLMGFLQTAINLCCFIMVTELFAASKRTMAGTLVHCSWGLFVGLLALLAFLIPNWVHLQLTISLSGLACVPLFWITSESVPWLHANGRLAEAELIVRNAAKMNKVKLPEIIFLVKEEEETEEEGEEEEENLNAATKTRITFPSKRFHSHHFSASYSLLDLVKSRKLLLYLVVCCFQWVTLTLVYYGLTLTTGEMAGNRFLNGFYSGIVEVPAYIAAYFLINKFGRKKMITSAFIFTALSLFLMVLIPQLTTGNVDIFLLVTALSIIGKFGITCCFGIELLYTAELFPTNLRNRAIGIASFVGRLGNLTATFSLYSIKLYPKLTIIIFGILSFIAGLSTFLLPETKGCCLPTTIEEIEAWTKTNVIENERPDITIELLQHEEQKLK